MRLLQPARCPYLLQLQPCQPVELVLHHQTHCHQQLLLLLLKMMTHHMLGVLSAAVCPGPWHPAGLHCQCVQHLQAHLYLLLLLPVQLLVLLLLLLLAMVWRS
jgi:hypothetical protein